MLFVIVVFNFIWVNFHFFRPTQSLGKVTLAFQCGGPLRESRESKVRPVVDARTALRNLCANQFKAAAHRTLSSLRHRFFSLLWIAVIGDGALVRLQGLLPLRSEFDYFWGSRVLGPLSVVIYAWCRLWQCRGSLRHWTLSVATRWHLECRAVCLSTLECVSICHYIAMFFSV